MNPIPITSKNFQRIIQFYLFESPVMTHQRKTKEVLGRTPNQPHPKFDYGFRRVSKRGVTFADRNLDGAKLNSLRAAMMRVTDVKLMAVDDGVARRAEAMGGAEYVVIRRNDYNVSVTGGFFYCIRNAFAHGDFDVVGKPGNRVYLLRNEAFGKLKGLARLKESSLLAWIDLVNMDIEDIKKAGR